MNDAALSPFHLHHHVMRGTRPSQAWDGRDPAPWRRKLRRTVRRMTGFDRIDADERCPLRVKTVWRKDHPLGTIEKIRFTVEPGCEATAFVCLPAEPVTDSPKLPWMICLQGHSSGAHNSIGVERDDNHQTMAVEGDRDFGLQCMQRGVAAVCLEQRCFGERREREMHPERQGGCLEASMQALLVGRTMVGERVFDVDRVLDWLWSRDDVDRKRVGVMGNSGGGTTTVFAAALLPRLRFAMPSCYLCTIETCIGAMHHCSCNYVPDLLLEADLGDVMGCFVPKPVVVVAGKQDPIFPIAGVRKAVKQLRRIYAAAGAEDRVHFVIGPEGHRFYAEPAWKQAMRYLR